MVRNDYLCVILIRSSDFMSIQSINNSIASVNREILSLENQIHTINNNIARKEKEANAILSKINREKDLNRMITLQKDLTRKNEEINKLSKDKASKVKTLSDKQNKQTKLNQDLSKEEQKERDKTKKEQKEMLSLQQSITREMERQRTISANSFQTTHFQAEFISTDKKYDVFVSHASEDKETFVRPFVEALQANDIAVWYDEFELRLGDSLRRSIDNGFKELYLWDSRAF